MHRITIRLDRVFDVQTTYFRPDANGNALTRFGFESEGQIHEDVVIEGSPMLVSGTKITAVLARDGEWKSLVALRIHGSDKIYAPHVSGKILILGLTALFCGVFGVMAGENDVPFLVMLALLQLIATIWLGQSAYIAWWARKTLMRNDLDESCD